MGINAVDEVRMFRNFQTFNEQGGKFRVAVLNRCNLDCFFCHNEAMSNPRVPGVERKPEKLNVDWIIKIINAYSELGGVQINVTGGEPLLHPEIIRILSECEKKNTRIMLNTNGIPAERLLRIPRIDALDGILVSLHTTDPEIFRKKMAGGDIQRVMNNILRLKRHGYAVEVNFSLGPYNQREFDSVLDFTVSNGLDLKAITLVRSDEDPEFYGGDWVDPVFIGETLARRNAVKLGARNALGGRTVSYRVGETIVKVKNIAKGRLRTDFCKACPHLKYCGEGIYGLRVGVDGLWKPCLLRQDKFSEVSKERDLKLQILRNIDEMMGNFQNSEYAQGAPS